MKRYIRKIIHIVAIAPKPVVVDNKNQNSGCKKSFQFRNRFHNQRHMTNEVFFDDFLLDGKLPKTLRCLPLPIVCLYACHKNDDAEYMVP